MSVLKSRYVAQEGVAIRGSEVLGAGMLALIQNLQADEIKPYLEKYHLSTIDPNQWYSEQLVLDILFAIENSQINSTENLVAIGMKIIDTMPFPAGTTTIEQALSVISVAAAAIGRNIPEGQTLEVMKQRLGYVLVTANIPYPSSQIYGYLWALAKRFKPSPESTFSVVSVANPDPANYPGRAYEITWN